MRVQYCNMFGKMSIQTLKITGILDFARRPVF
jgi:hypothetical protein